MNVKPKAPNRDEVTTINEDGSRYFVHPSDVRGRITLLRRVAGWLLTAVYVALPLVPVNGAPAVFLDVVNRRFHLFGITLVTQDLWLMFFVITGLGFTLFCVTALLGRVWCGWACPQTVFLDVFFRRVERLIDGDAPARRRLDKAAWNSGKVFKRVVKHVFYLVGAFVIAHLFLAYFVSLHGLYSMMHGNPGEHWGVFVFVMVFTGILYFNFAWFREQFCIVLCPYGRLQSALVDDDTINIGYDEIRGEPRGKVGTEGAGDCIDCRRCVQVCPTGIDIRQGLQLECIACAACIDACDEVMVRLKRPKGLVRFDSFNGLAGLGKTILRPRLMLYAVLLVAGAGVMTFALGRVATVTVSALRMTGAPYYRDAEELRNNFLLRVINKSNHPEEFTVTIHDPEGVLHLSESDGIALDIAMPAHGEVQRPLVIQMPSAAWKGNFEFELRVGRPGAEPLVTKTLPFLGPYRSPTP